MEYRGNSIIIYIIRCNCCFPPAKHHGRGGWCLHRQTTHVMTSPQRGQRRPPVLPSLKQLHTHGVNYRHGSGGALTRCAAVCSPGDAQFPPEPAALPACLRCLPAKSDAVIAPCAADGEPLSPPAPPRFLSGWLSRRQCGCGARNATLFTRRPASEEKMKCFSRYLPYLFRPPSTILSSTCHTEGRVGRRGGCQGL